MSFAASMPDVLSGGALVMAVLAALFAIWQADIAKAIDAPVHRDRGNRQPEKALIASVLWRVIPLFLASFAATILLIFRSGTIVAHAAACGAGLGAGDDCSLDEAAGLLVLTEALLILLVVAIGKQT